LQNDLLSLSSQNSFVVTAMLLVCLAVLLALTISAAQSFIGQKAGSDHPVHVFLTRRIRKNHFQLFVKIPDLLNDSYCAAVPLYIHWIIAHFRTRMVFWSELLLNPAVNAAHVALLAGVAVYICRRESLPLELTGLSALLFALTPQFYHALSARNFGLSARGTGLFMLTAFFSAAYAAESQQMPGIAWPAMAILGWLVWGFSTFAQQALCILSLLLFLLTGRYVPLVGALLGLGVFIALHPRYSAGYLRHTLRFIETYAKELAPIYILQRRPSIWRDLIWDIWRRFPTQGTGQGVRYAYENSVIVICMLNPLTVWCCWIALHGQDLQHGIFGFCLSLTLCGALAAFATSFRVTRFLGEPERYVETMTPWAVLFGAHAIFERQGASALISIAAIFLLVDLAQLLGSGILVKYVGESTPKLERIESLIDARWGTAARVCSNNEHYTKMLMKHDWKYAYCFAVGQLYCGMTTAQSFSRFPVLRPQACERIAEELRINACLLDRKEYDSLFAVMPPALKNMSVAYESARFRLLFLEWASPDENSGES
jgi:hypothetical protein